MLPEDTTKDPKKSPNDSTAVETETEFKSKAEQVYDSVDDWKEDVEFPGLYYSKKLNILYCPNHKKAGNRGGMSRHFRSDHVEMKSITAKAKSLGQQLGKITEQASTIVVVQTPDQMILEDHNREVAEAAGMLAKDYELRAEYEMLHQQDRIPYDWSFYDWIKLGCVVNWNEKWKVNLTLNQDVGQLDEKQLNWLKLTLAENAQKRKAESEEVIE